MVLIMATMPEILTIVLNSNRWYGQIGVFCTNFRFQERRLIRTNLTISRRSIDELGIRMCPLAFLLVRRGPRGSKEESGKMRAGCVIENTSQLLDIPVCDTPRHQNDIVNIAKCVYRELAP